MRADSQEETVEALLAATRALVGLAARSLADVDPEVTLPQFRALVVLATRGPQKLVDVSSELGVNPSTGTRMSDRLINKGLARRVRARTDRRVVRLRLAPEGSRLVDMVIKRRRTELARIVAATAQHWDPRVLDALHAFADATGEVPPNEWWLGWAARDQAVGA